MKKEDLLEKFLKGRIRLNKDLFGKKEKRLILKNMKTMKKIYIMGLLD